MRKIYALFSFLLMVLGLIACGKLNENFSRQRKDYTLVNFRGEHSGFESMTSQLGGVMIYIMNQSASGQGMIVGFSNENLGNASAILVPNGTYKIYALGFAGSYVGGGQVRCGYGSNGANISLSGSSQTIPITIGLSNCNFGGSSDFSYAANADEPSNTNFDDWIIRLCTGSPYPSCTAATSSTNGVKVILMAGSGGGNSVTHELPSRQLESSCIPSSSGTFYFTSGKLNVPISTTFAMPMKIVFYSDSSCASSVVRTFSLTSGLKAFLTASSSSTTYVSSAASSSQTFVDFYKDF